MLLIHWYNARCAIFDLQNGGNLYDLLKALHSINKCECYPHPMWNMCTWLVRWQLIACLLKGIAHIKRKVFSPEKKMLWTKKLYHEVSQVCFLSFSVKRKESDLHRKYKHLGKMYLAENVSSSTILQIYGFNKIYGFIPFTMTRSRA